MTRKQAFHGLALALFSLLLSGCLPEGPETRFILAAAGAATGQLVWKILLWTLFLGFLGAVLGGVLGWGVLAVSDFKRSRGGGAWVRGLLAAGLFLSILGIGVALGFLEGTVRGTESVLASSDLVRKAYGPIGEGASDLTAALYTGMVAYQGPAGEFEVSEAAVEGFRRGNWELNVVDLNLRLRRLGRAGVEKVVSEMRDFSLEIWPDAPVVILDILFDTLVRGINPESVMLTAEIAGGSNETAIRRGLGSRLMAAARESGDPETLTRGELSEQLTLQFLVRPTTKIMRPMVLSIQIPLVLIGIALTGLAGMLLVVAFFVVRVRGPRPTGPLPTPTDGAGAGGGDWF